MTREECEFIRRFHDFGCEIAAGVTTLKERKQRARDLIRERFLMTVAGRHDGKPEFFEDRFARVYGEPL